jgi:hypothetical protein
MNNTSTIGVSFALEDHPSRHQWLPQIFPAAKSLAVVPVCSPHVAEMHMDPIFGSQ